jgi:hypothetical protein
MNSQDCKEFRAYLKIMTREQIEAIIEKEGAAGRHDYQNEAIAEKNFRAYKFRRENQ